MTLRNIPDEKIANEKDELLRIVGKVEGTVQRQFLYKIAFLKIEIELKEYFFKYHSTKIPNLRYLIGIPTVDQNQIDEIIDSVRHTKKVLANEHYKLIDGRINEKEVKAMNCVNGFLLGNNLIWLTQGGIVSNPKPQLAAWSFLTFVLGSDARDKLLAGTSIERDSDKEELLESIVPTHRQFKI